MANRNNPSGLIPRRHFTGGTIRATQENGQSYPIISGVSFGIGGLACAGAVAFYFIGKKVDREAPKLTLLPSFGPSGGGLVATARFP